MRKNGRLHILILGVVVAGLPLGTGAASSRSSSPPSRLSVSCGASAMCSPSVAVVDVRVSSGGAPLNACLGTSVGPNLTLTSLHCLAPNLRAPGAVCRDQIKFYFPALAGFAAETLECDTVVAVSPPPPPERPDDPYVPDWALVKTRGDSVRPVARVSFDGIRDRTRLSVATLRLGLSANARTAEIGSVSCTAVQNSVAQPLFVSDSSSTVGLPSCRLSPGSSGGPLTDADGVVRAITIASFDSGDAVRSSHSVATNLACVRAVGVSGWERGELDRACEAEFGSEARVHAFHELIERVGTSSPLDPVVRAARGDTAFEMRNSESVPDGGASFIRIRHPVSPYCIDPSRLDASAKPSQLVTARIGYVLQTFSWANEDHTVSVSYSTELTDYVASLRAASFASGQSVQVRFRPAVPAAGVPTLERTIRLCQPAGSAP